MCVRRFDRPAEFIVYPIVRERPLPRIGGPLLPGDADLKVDLQGVFRRCHHLGPYAREIDYGRQDILPPLSEDQTRRLLSIFETLRRLPAGGSA